jgi:hypothetical protein
VGANEASSTSYQRSGPFNPRFGSHKCSRFGVDNLQSTLPSSSVALCSRNTQLCLCKAATHLTRDPFGSHDKKRRKQKTPIVFFLLDEQLKTTLPQLHVLNRLQQYTSGDSALHFERCRRFTSVKVGIVYAGETKSIFDALTSQESVFTIPCKFRGVVGVYRWQTRCVDTLHRLLARPRRMLVIYHDIMCLLL